MPPPKLLRTRQNSLFFSPCYHISAMASRDEKIERLHAIFGHNTDLTRSILGEILDGENGDFDRAVDVLLNMTSDATRNLSQKRQQALSQNPSQRFPSQSNTDAEKIKELEKHKNIRHISNMFGNQLSESVITVVYEKNTGDVTSTVDTLLNIQEDPEALHQIRAMKQEVQSPSSRSAQSATSTSADAKNNLNPQQTSQEPEWQRQSVSVQQPTSGTYASKPNTAVVSNLEKNTKDPQNERRQTEEQQEKRRREQLMAKERQLMELLKKQEEDERRKIDELKKQKELLEEQRRREEERKRLEIIEQQRQQEQEKQRQQEQEKQRQQEQERQRQQEQERQRQQEQEKQRQQEQERQRQQEQEKQRQQEQERQRQQEQERQRQHEQERQRQQEQDTQRQQEQEKQRQEEQEPTLEQ